MQFKIFNFFVVIYNSYRCCCLLSRYFSHSFHPFFPSTHVPTPSPFFNLIAIPRACAPKSRFDHVVRPFWSSICSRWTSQWNLRRYNMKILTIYWTLKYFNCTNIFNAFFGRVCNILLAIVRLQRKTIIIWFRSARKHETLRSAFEGEAYSLFLR